MISSITNIQTYVIGYTSQQVELEMDITTNSSIYTAITSLQTNSSTKTKSINWF